MKIFFSRTTKPISNTLGTKHCLVKETQVLAMKNYVILNKGIFFLSKHYGLLNLCKNVYNMTFRRKNYLFSQFTNNPFRIISSLVSFLFSCRLICGSEFNVINGSETLMSSTFHNIIKNQYDYNKYLFKVKTPIIIKHLFTGFE